MRAFLLDYCTEKWLKIVFTFPISCGMMYLVKIGVWKSPAPIFFDN